MTVLSAKYTTVAFYASVTNPFGKEALINLLRQFVKVFHSYFRIKKSRKLTKYLRPKPCVERFMRRTKLREF